MRSVSQRAAYLAMWVSTSILGSLPEPVIRHLGRIAGYIWYAVDPPRRRMARRHMRRLGVEVAAAREMFASYGRYWAESFWVRPRHFKGMRSRMTVTGLEHLEQARSRGKGVVLVLPHIGNWEAAALIALDIDLPLVAVAEKLANPYITKWFTRQRNMFGIEIVLAGDGRVGPRLAAALRDGKAVALLSDRDLTGRGVKVEFFGEATTLPAGPVSLARKTGAPIVPVGIYFKRGGGHDAAIHPALPDAHPDEDIAAGVQDIAERLELIIRRDPSQWHLVQPNWPSDRA